MQNVKVYFLVFSLFLLQATVLKAQDDLLDMLEKENPGKPTPVYATFKTTRVITGQSNEQVSAKHLNFVILHRFGNVNDGVSTLYGLDEANMRLVFDYGITRRIQVGVARTNMGKTYDGNLKIKILEQKKGGGSPITLSYYGNTAISSEEWADPNRHNYFTSRMSFFNQLILARKFGDAFSFQLAPTMVHQNLVTNTSDLNTTYALGVGGSIRLNRSFRFNFEAYPRITGRDMKNAAGQTCYDYLALGFDIETGGHVFQLMLCNGRGMLEQHMVRNTTTQWSDLSIRLGFNISRTFSFDNSQKKDKKW